MAQTAAKYAGTVAEDASAGTTAWSNPTNAQGSNDSTVATAASAAGGVFTRRLKATNFGFTASDIPTGSTINGFIIRTRVRGGTNNRAYMNELFVVKGGTTQTGATNLGEGSGTTWSNSLANRSYGGASQKFGLSWTVADVTASDFGLSLQAGRNNTTTAEVAWFEVVVDYTAPVTHTNTGTPTADAATVAGTAAHLTLHATSGALAAEAATVAGTAAHLTLHASSGALAAGSAEVAGSAGVPVLSSGDSVRVDTASLIAGKVVVGDRGLGVLGSTIPSTGEHGAALLYNDLDLPAEDNDEFRALITDWPVGLTLFVNEDSSFTASGADGEYVGEYEGFKNGVSYGTAEFTITIGGATTHATSGALASDAATVAGSATHLTLHATSGALEAGSATTAGTAAHQHVATGAIEATTATVAGTAVHLTLHETTGAIEAAAATVAGTAAHEHATTGALVAAAATVAGDAELTAAAAEHATTGDLAASAADVDGTAAHLTLHATDGELAADAATVSGTAFQAHDTTGALAAQAATVFGTAAHEHAATGALASQAATAEGSAIRLALHVTSGALVAGSATLDGTALRLGGHVTEGNLSAQAASVVGSAAVSVEGGLSPKHAAWLEALARLHGLVDPLTVSSTARGDGTVVQTVAQEGGTVTITTVSAPTGDDGDSPLTAQQAEWLEGLVRLHGLIEPLSVTTTSRGDGTVQQTISTTGGTTTVTTQ
jgi:hypothetical protein